MSISFRWCDMPHRASHGSRERFDAILAMKCGLGSELGSRLESNVVD
jgi:hypothetical protein